MDMNFYRNGSESGSGCGSGGGHEDGRGRDEGSGAGIGTGSGWGNWQPKTEFLLSPGVYVVTEPMPVVLPEGAHLVCPINARMGRGFGSQSMSIEPDVDEGLITHDKDEALRHFERIPGGAEMQSGDGSGRGRGASIADAEEHAPE